MLGAIAVCKVVDLIVNYVAESENMEEQLNVSVEEGCHNEL
jgi:hypothetical protein